MTAGERPRLRAHTSVSNDTNPYLIIRSCFSGHLLERSTLHPILVQLSCLSESYPVVYKTMKKRSRQGRKR